MRLIPKYVCCHSCVCSMDTRVFHRMLLLWELAALLQECPKASCLPCTCTADSSLISIPQPNLFFLWNNYLKVSLQPSRRPTLLLASISIALSSLYPQDFATSLPSEELHSWGPEWGYRERPRDFSYLIHQTYTFRQK